MLSAANPTIITAVVSGGFLVLASSGNLLLFRRLRRGQEGLLVAQTQHELADAAVVRFDLLARMDTRMTTMQNQLDATRGMLSSDGERINSLEQDARLLHQKIRDLIAERDRLQAMLVAANTDRARLQTDLETERTSKAAIQTELRRVSAELEAVQKRLDGVEKEQRA